MLYLTTMHSKLFYYIAIFFLNAIQLCWTQSERYKHRVEWHLSDYTPANHLIGNIFTGSYLRKTYLRLMLTPDTYFRLTNDGDFYTTESLDRDIICKKLGCCSFEFCQLTVEAYLFDTDPLPITVHVTVFLADENDNAPLFPEFKSTSINDSDGGGNDFDENIYDLSIPESAPIGSKHNLPAAMDADSPRFGVHLYRLKYVDDKRRVNSPNHLSNDDSPFSLYTPTSGLGGSVSLKAPQLQVDLPLDREQRSVYHYRLLALDAGTPALQGSLLIRVRIQDINDNAPIFMNISTDGFGVTLQENTSVGTIVHKFSVLDPDEGRNGNITFTIDWKSTLSDLSSPTSMNIQSKYTIDRSTGELRIASPLDYENEYERRIALVIVATDHGSPQLSASITFTVTLNDVNDNAPVIEITEIGSQTDRASTNKSSVLLNENDSDPKLLKLISVKDADSVSNGRLNCRLIERKSMQPDFRLVQYSETLYGLLSARAFDYETEASKTGYLSVGLECLDSAEPNLSSQKWVEIPLGDLNDNWPQFSQANYEINIPEDVLSDTEIGQILATDRDSGVSGQITYQLSSDNTDFLKYIRIDGQTGRIYSTSSFDREILPTLDYHVTAFDGGEKMVGSPTLSEEKRQATVKTNTTSLRINILDVNDNAPNYKGPVEVHIPENVPIGTEILSKLLYEDPDLEENGTISISLFDSPYNHVSKQTDLGTYEKEDRTDLGYPKGVSVDKNMRLIVTGMLDREHQAQLVLTLLATDKGKAVQQSSTTSLTVYIDDINDNAPRLLYPRNASLLFGMAESSGWLNGLTSSTIPADTPAGTLVATIRGKDPDAGENGTVTYHLVSGKPWDFKQSLPFSQIFEGEVGTTDYLSQMVQLTDGCSYFAVDEESGQLTTFWGEISEQLQLQRQQHFNRSRLGEEKNTTNERFRYTVKMKTEPPKPGLYALMVELRDQGRNMLSTKVIFYVNISEAIGSRFGFWNFGDSNMSNTVILILIIVCSLALIISLTAAIFWVRFRSDGGSVNQMTGNHSASYQPATLLSHDHSPNGFYYPTNLSPLGTQPKYDEFEHGYLQTEGSFLSNGDGIPQPKWNGPIMDYTNSQDYQSGMYGGTLLPGTVISCQSLPYTPYKGPLSDQSSSQSMSMTNEIHIFPINSAGELKLIQPHRDATPDWGNSPDKYNPQQVMYNQNDMGYANLVQINDSGQGVGTNNSTGGSDSGVDSGVGLVGSNGPNFSSSPISEIEKNMYKTLTPAVNIVHTPMISHQDFSLKFSSTFQPTMNRASHTLQSSFIPRTVNGNLDYNQNGDSELTWQKVADNNGMVSSNKSTRNKVSTSCNSGGHILSFGECNGID